MVSLEAQSGVAQPSESTGTSSGEADAQQQEESLQQGGSVNWDAPGAPNSPRVPRSQVSRAHPPIPGFGERTSAVLSALSGDDETALSAAEAAGEHTSEMQEAVGGVGDALGEGGGGNGALPHDASGQQQQQPALSLTRPTRRGRGGFELASSPPASTSPIYRANSLVSHTAAMPFGGGRQQQAGARRGAETPASAPPVGGAQGVLGSSPPTSRGEFSAAVPQPRLPRRGAFSAGLPPTSGQRPSHYQGPAGPSRPSLSGTQSYAATAAHSMPSTMAVVQGVFSPPGGLAQQLAPHGHGGLSLPTPQPPAYGCSPGVGGLLPLAVSMGLPASHLGSMAAALLQAQSSVLGTQQQQQQQHQQSEQAAQQQQQQLQQLQAAQQQVAQAAHQAGQQAATSQTAMPPPAPLQQAEALQNMAAMLQAQASAIVSGSPCLQEQQEGEQQAAPGSGGATSAQSLPSLVGASAIQGHPLPPPFYGGAGATTPAPLQSFGGGTPVAGGAAPPTVGSGAFAGPRRLQAAAMAATPLPHPTATAVSEIHGSAVQPAAAALLAQQAALEQGGGEPAAAGDLAALMQQATSAVLGSGHAGGHGGHVSPRQRQRTSPHMDPQQAAAEEERRRHAGDLPQPQAAVIVELATADVASQGGGAGGPGCGLLPAEPQEAAMLGGNSTFGEAMEVGGDEDDAMEVQQAAAPAGHLPPAPHGAASVMATLMTDNGGGRSDGDTEMGQQAASGPSRSAAALRPAQSLSRSMDEPAAATAHNTGARSGLTEQPSQQGPAASNQQGPATSNQGQVAHAPSCLGTLSTGDGEGVGGSVEMSALPAQQGAQYATSAPAVVGALHAAAAAHAAPLAAAEPAVSHHAPGAPPLVAGAAHAALSAPAAAPPPHPAHAPLAAVLAAQPAASVSMSGQGDTPGQQFFVGTSVAAMPQSSAAAAPLLPAHASPRAQRLRQQQQQQQHEGGGEGPAAAGAAGAAGPAGTGIKGMASPAVSMHEAAAAAPQPQESRGTARGTILAGAAHSILTTAAVGESEMMDEGGEALSPLLVKAQQRQAAGAAAKATGALPLAATPGSGSVGAPAFQPQPPLAAMPAAAAGQAAAAASGQPVANGAAHPDGEPAAAGVDTYPSPIDYSTMAVDLAPAGPDPQPSASFQPSSLPPPGAVAAALAALEAQQTAQNGGPYYTPPPGAASLGEGQQLQQQNGYATHANSAIGNGHVAQSSPEREMTSPSRLLTHDSTGSGGGRQHSTKRRRTSAGAAGSTQRS